MSRLVHLMLSTAAQEAIRQGGSRRNRVGRSLRDWLAHAYAQANAEPLYPPTLFTSALLLDDDIPPLLEAASRASSRRPENLIEAWVLEEPDPNASAGPPDDGANSGVLPDDLSGRVAELLGIAQTLFEETVADADRRLGGYAAGRAAEQSAVGIYNGLRRFLGLPLE